MVQLVVCELIVTPFPSFSPSIHSTNMACHPLWGRLLGNTDDSDLAPALKELLSYGGERFTKDHHIVINARAGLSRASRVQGGTPLLDTPAWGLRGLLRGRGAHLGLQKEPGKESRKRPAQVWRQHL